MRSIVCIIVVSLVSAESFQLRIIHTNDQSFQLNEYSENGETCKSITEPTTVYTSTTVTTPQTTPASTTTTSSVSSTFSSTTDETSESTSESITTVTEDTTTEPITTVTEDTTTEPIETNTEEKATEQWRKDTMCYGGVPRIVRKVSELRNDSVYQSLYIDAGGIIRANRIFQLAKSDTAVNVTKILKPDVIVPSVEDFKQGFVESMNFFAGIKQNKIDVLAANIRVFDSKGENISFEASHIYDFDSVKVGVIGFVSEDVKNFLPGSSIVEDPSVAILREITTLQSQGVFIIIVAGSSTISEAKSLLNRFKEIDVIVSGGGDSYFMYNTDMGSAPDPVNETYPYKLEDGTNYPQFAVQVPHKGKYLGNLELEIDPEIGAITSTKSSNPIIMDNSIDEDTEAEKYVEETLTEIEALLEEEMAVLEYKISAQNCSIGECTAGNCITEAVWEYLIQEEKVMEKPAVVFWRSSLMTGEIEEGKVNLEEILKMYPTNTIVGLAKLKGSELKQFLEISLNNNGTGNNLQFYGARVTYQLAQPDGKRVKEISVLKSGGELHYATVTEEEVVTIAVDGEMFHLDPYTNLLQGKGELLQFYNSTSSWYISSSDALFHFFNSSSSVSIAKEGKISFFVAPPPPKNPDYTGTVFLTIFITVLVELLAYAAYTYVWPKLRQRRGSLVSLLR
ncbi:snake venom 5'-nucleotidase-like [Artemia franciscana]|uniref:5'-nucleotidase n=1 Tax=Artemia franciscana TaxID=6661 RepID=A0AA88HZ57_ARTSF|nr:hypothetical protein QYM36_006635 [Artemia franciscana]